MSELHKAILAVQSEVGTLPKNADNPFFKSKYTPLDTIVETLQPLLTKHGLTWTTFPIGTQENPELQYCLTHAETGDTMSGSMPLFLAKNDPQGQGSAITYARRYALCAVLNLVADVDDDGNAASKPGKRRDTLPGGTDQTVTPNTHKPFAEKLRGKKKGPEIRAWAAEQGFSLDAVGTSGADLTKFLNGLSAEHQTKILAWAAE